MARLAPVALAPIILANDPLPQELVLAADTACHQSSNLLLRSSGLCLALRRGAPLSAIEDVAQLIATEARAIAAASERIAQTIASLKARAAS